MRSAYNDYDELARILFIYTNRKLQNYASDKDTITIVIFKLIQGAMTENWVYDLIKAALAERPNNQLLRAFIENYPVFDPSKPPPKPKDYYESYFVLSNYLFIGRPELRKKLRELRTSDESTRILLVDGNRMSGKTYSRQLIGYLASKFEKHHVIPIDLDKYQYEPYEVCLVFAQEMGFSQDEIRGIPVQQGELMDKYVQFLCNWIKGQVNKAKDKIFWFVFDGFREKVLSEGIEDMIINLAGKVENEMLHRNCYLVVLNYTNILPYDLATNALKESAKIIDKDDLLSFIERLFVDNGKNYQKEDLEKVVDEIFEQTEAQIIAEANGDTKELQKLQEERLKYLSRATNEAVKRYKQNNFKL